MQQTTIKLRPASTVRPAKPRTPRQRQKQGLRLKVASLQRWLDLNA